MRPALEARRPSNASDATIPHVPKSGLGKTIHNVCYTDVNERYGIDLSPIRDKSARVIHLPLFEIPSRPMMKSSNRTTQLIMRIHSSIVIDDLYKS